MKNIDPKKEVCSFLEKKLTLFNRYLSITKRMKKALRDKEAVNPGVFLSERQECINKIRKIDSSIEKIIKASTDKLNHISDKFTRLIHGYLSSIKSIMETVDLIDRELMVMVKEEGEGIKKELLRIWNGRQVARDYKKEKRYTPRFLDTIR
jgi:DNA topoisomerase VI subunit B